MERNKIILIVLILSVSGLFFSGCNGKIPTVPENDATYDSTLIQVKDLNCNIIYMAGKINNEAMAILGEKDNQGNPKEITGFSYISDEGESFYLEAGEDGLPIYVVDAKGNKIFFTNYTTSTVDITVYDSEGNLTEYLTTKNIDPQDLLEIQQLYDSFHLKQKYLPWWENFLDYPFLNDWILNTFKFTSLNSIHIYDEYGHVIDYKKPWENDENIFSLIIESSTTTIWVQIINNPPSYLSTILESIEIAEESVVLYNESKEIKEVINGFFQALSDQKFDEARSYCIYGSAVYNGVATEEDYWNFDESNGMIDTNYYVNIVTIIVDEDYAEVNIKVNKVYVSPCGEAPNYLEICISLKKSNSDWKLYNSCN